MNKRWKRFLAVLLSGCMVAAMTAGCGSSEKTDDSAAKTEETSAEAPEEEEAAGEEAGEAKRGYRFTWVNPVVGLEYWAMAEKGMADADAKYGTDTQTVGPTEVNVDEQIKQIDAAIAAQVDGIITMALDPQAFEPAIQRAADAGIPVVCIDTDAPDSARAYYAGTSHYEFGYEAGKLVAENTDGKAKIGILAGVMTAPNMVERVDGFKAAISEYPDMEIVAIEDTNAELLLGTQKAQAMMQTYPDMNAIFCVGSTDAGAAGKVAVEMGLEDQFYIVGSDDMEDTIKYIRDGVVDATLVQQTYMMGYLGVELLVQQIEGNGPEDQIIDTGVIVVTSENVDSYKE